MNFVAPGSIGGDLFKAIFLAHGQPGRRTEAVATVIADRLLGVTTILVIASIGILATGLLERTEPDAQSTLQYYARGDRRRGHRWSNHRVHPG